MAKTAKKLTVVKNEGLVSGLGETPEQLKEKSAELSAKLAALFGKKTLTQEQLDAAYQLGLVERRRRKLDRKIRKANGSGDEE